MSGINMFIISGSFFGCQLHHPGVLRKKACDSCFLEESPSKHLLLYRPTQPRWLCLTALESLRFANLPIRVPGQRCRLFLFVLLPEAAHLAYDRWWLSSLSMTGRDVWSPKPSFCQLLSYTAPTLLRRPPLRQSHTTGHMRLLSIRLSGWKLLTASHFFHFTDSSVSLPSKFLTDLSSWRLSVSLSPNPAEACVLEAGFPAHWKPWS